MKMKNIMEKCKSTVGKIDHYYDIPVSAMCEIADNSKDWLDLAYNCFRLGYLQGSKAAKAKQKRATGRGYSCDAIRGQEVSA